MHIIEFIAIELHLNFTQVHSTHVLTLMRCLYFSDVRLYLVKCGSKNGHQKHMYMKEIGWRAQILLTILAQQSPSFGGGGTYMIIQWEGGSSFWEQTRYASNMDMSSTNYKEFGYMHNLDLWSPRIERMFQIIWEVDAKLK